MEVVERNIKSYVTDDGKVPFDDWGKGLKDTRGKARVLNRIDRLRLGNFGDCKSIGNGVYELRVHFGPGYRIYFGLLGAEVVLLLCGGQKRTQKQDVILAHRYWKEFNRDAQ